MTNFTCDKCNTRVPHNRPILTCSFCKQQKHYNCHNVSKNEAYEIINTGQMSYWACTDCIDSPLLHLLTRYIVEPAQRFNRPTNRQDTSHLPSCSTCNKPCSPNNSTKTAVCVWSLV